MENKLSRTKIHEQAFIVIFQYLFYEENDLKKDKKIEEIVSDVMECSFDECDDFFKVIVFETIKNRKEYIEKYISPKLVGWEYQRLYIADKAILLLFTSEIINHRVESHVAIDMAVDLSHRYGNSEKSYKFINKVLDRISKEDAR